MILHWLDLRTSDINANYGSLRMLCTTLAFVAVAVSIGQVGLPGAGHYGAGRGVVIGIYVSVAWLTVAGLRTIILVVMNSRTSRTDHDSR